MTLFKQIIIILSILFTIIFSCVMLLNFNSSKAYVEQQAYTDALHTANSLGLAISTVASVNDVSTAETMINSVFDSGYYEKIILRDMNKHILVSKKQKVIVPGVPSWFIKNIKLIPPVAKSQIMLGWTPYGVLSVQLNSGLAYMQLWTIFKDLLSVFIIISIIGFFILHLTLRFILRPIKRVKEQAEAILNNDFILQEEIPSTTELKNVVFAMNSMVKKVKEIFQKEIDAVQRYKEFLYKDKLVDMYNRRYFNIKLQEYLGSEEKNSQGGLILISLNNFNAIKNEIGYEKSEIAIKEIADSIKKTISKNQEFIAAKIGDEDFAVLAPTTSQESLNLFCSEIIELIKKIIISFKLDIKKYYINIGYTKYYSNSNTKELFSKADFALASSKSKGAFNIDIFDNKNDETDIFLGKEAWAKALHEALEEKRFMLAYQNVVEIDDFTSVLHSELFLRLQDNDDLIHNAGYFMPMASELKLGFQIDQYVIEKVASLSRKKSFPFSKICINLGKEIFLQSENYAKLEESIMNFRKINNYMLYFEVKSSNIPTNILIRFSKYLRGIGYRLGLDSFVLNAKNLVLMQQINPSYIKVHASYLLDLSNENDSIIPSKSLGIVTDSMNIKIIASFVENEDQREKLRKLGIKYIQGSLVEEPSLLG